MKKSLLLFLSIVFLRQLNAQVYVAIPDSNFVHYLKTIVPSAFKGDSLNKISPLVTTSTRVIFLPQYASISNVDGVQYFSSLDSLNCDFNTISSLPSLPNSLHYLSICCNTLTSLPTLPPGLIYLNINSNHQITSLPVLPNTLITLACSYNNLTTLPTLPPSLTHLDCRYNNITCFTNFPNSITSITIDPNLYNCLPNHIAAMNSTDLVVPLCAAGNTNGCAVAGIKQINSSNNLSIYPNPANDQLYIETNAFNKISVDLHDVNGRQVYSAAVKDKSNIDISGLDEGIYSLTIKTEASIINKKLVIVR